MSPSELVVRFDSATQSIAALREAAYRIMARASCVIDTADGTYICRLLPKISANSGAPDSDLLRREFIDLVTDETLREQVTRDTSRIRDVIIALAFGALASQAKPPLPIDGSV